MPCGGGAGLWYFSQAKKKGLPCGKPFVLFGGYTGT